MTTKKEKKTSAQHESAQQRQQKVNAIMTSNKTTGEILAELQKIIPQFDYEEAK